MSLKSIRNSPYVGTGVVVSIVASAITAAAVGSIAQVNHRDARVESNLGTQRAAICHDYAARTGRGEFVSSGARADQVRMVSCDFSRVPVPMSEAYLDSFSPGHTFRG